MTELRDIEINQMKIKCIFLNTNKNINSQHYHQNHHHRSCFFFLSFYLFNFV